MPTRYTVMIGAMFTSRLSDKHTSRSPTNASCLKVEASTTRQERSRIVDSRSTTPPRANGPKHLAEYQGRPLDVLERAVDLTGMQIAASKRQFTNVSGNELDHGTVFTFEASASKQRVTCVNPKLRILAVR